MTTSITHKLTKEQFDNIIDENISVKEYKNIIKLLGDRFNYIVHTIASIVGREVQWYDYDNEYSGGGEHSPGSFDKKLYSEEIDYVGEFKYLKNEDFDKYDYSFPTSWLYSDFESIVSNELIEFQQAKQTKKDLQIKQATDLKSLVTTKKADILSKLSDEDKFFISFNSPETVKRNLAELEKEKRLSLSDKKAAVLAKLSDEDKLFVSFNPIDVVIKQFKDLEKQKNIENYKSQKKIKPS